MIGNMSAQNKPMLSWKMAALADLMAFLPGDTEGQKDGEKSDRLASEREAELQISAQHRCVTNLHGCTKQDKDFCSEIQSHILRDYPSQTVLILH